MPLQSTYDSQPCPVAHTLEIVGERWTLLIVRDAFFGLRRFEQFQANLGVARNVLQTRLTRLVEAGVFTRVRYQQRPERFEYQLTGAGLDLWPVIVSLMQWGDAHAPVGGGPVVVLTHRGCGGDVDAHRTCTRCGRKLGPRDVWAQAGAGAPESHPLRRRPAREEPGSRADAAASGPPA